jgi:hypothetical protein
MLYARFFIKITLGMKEEEDMQETTEAVRNVKLVRTDMEGCEFRILRRPASGTQGYVKYSTGFAEDFKGQDEQGSPAQMFQLVDAELKAFEGQEQGQDDAEPLLVAQVKLILCFDVRPAGLSAEALRSFAWFFQGQAALLAQQRLAAMIAASPFRGMQLPFGV